MSGAGASEDDASRSRQRPAADAVRDQLDRILESPSFRGSARRKSLLRYVVEESLTGHADRVKGFSIAVEVFGRDETFDAQTDPVVRLEAYRLRRDLDGYYASAGSGDPIRISVPKGGYVPIFEWHDQNGIAARPIILDPPPAALAAGPAAPESTAAPMVAEHDDPAETAPAADETTGAGVRRTTRILLAGAALLTVLATVMWLGRGGQAPEPGAQQDARGPSVVVLPFEALSAGEDDRYLAFGMTQELITDLMRFDGFRVYSVPASFRQQSDADVEALGRSLAVSYVIRGGVRSDDDLMRVGAQLLDGRTGEVIWSETYDRAPTPGALLRVQSELASSIATALGQPYGVVHTHIRKHLSADFVPSMSSYTCVLRAYEYRRTFAAALYSPVLACLKEAVRRDPNYPEAWAMLGWLHLEPVRSRYVPDGEIGHSFDRALEAARRAVDLDGSNVLALKALSSILHYMGRHEESTRVQRAAVALNPNDPDALAQLGWRLASRGNFDEGIPYLERAIARSVSPPGWYYHLISVHDYLLGNYTDALAAAERSGKDGSSLGLSFMAISQGALGDGDAARRSLETLARLDPEFMKDPAAVYRTHQGTEEIIAALMEGLRKAGWRESDRSTAP